MFTFSLPVSKNTTQTLTGFDFKFSNMYLTNSSNFCPLLIPNDIGLIIRFGGQNISEVGNHFLVPQKPIIRPKQDLYGYQ